MQNRNFNWALLLRAGLMVGVTAAIGLAFWNPLTSEVRAQTRRITAVLARSMQTDILDEVRYQMLDLVRFASLLSLKPKLSQSDWDAQAKLFMNHHPGYIAIRWMDANYHTRGAAGDESIETYEPLPPVSDAAIQETLNGVQNRCESAAQFTSKLRLANGNIGRQVVVPICRERDFLGHLVVLIDEKKVLAEMLADDTGLGYGITIFDEGEAVFSTASQNSENNKKWGQEAHVPLLGATWRVRVWPESDMLHKIESPLPEQALLMGGIIGLLLFTTLDFARTSYFRSRELRLAHDELESRVEQRTAELQQANKELESQINERKRAEKSLQELSARLLQMRDEEQRRIARELHDSTVQIMGALAINLEKIQQLVPAGDRAKVSALLADGTELVERATAELRTISYLLHPPILDDLGLEGVLPWYAEGFSNRSGVKVNVELQSGLGRLPHELELTLFRIVQEGLTNIHRHSGSATAEIIVSRDAVRVTLRIVDHGKGMPAAALERVVGTGAVIGVGIAGMRERVRQLGGELEIESNTTGTSLTATLPMTGSNAREMTEDREAPANM